MAGWRGPLSDDNLTNRSLEVAFDQVEKSLAGEGFAPSDKLRFLLDGAFTLSFSIAVEIRKIDRQV